MCETPTMSAQMQEGRLTGSLPNEQSTPLPQTGGPLCKVNRLLGTWSMELRSRNMAHGAQAWAWAWEPNRFAAPN